MAALYGTNVTNLDASPPTLAPGNEVNGRVRLWYDTYEAAAASTSDTIEIARPRPGSNVLPQSMFMHDAMGTSSTVTVGDSGDPDRYVESYDWSSAGQKNFEAVATIGKIPFDITSDTDNIIMTVGGAAATGTIKSWILFTDGT